MKAGDTFIHARWLDENNQPLQCVVTAVRLGLVYWKQPGERKAKQFFPLDEAARYVKK